MYPNPASETIFIANNEATEIRIYSAEGKLVISTQADAGVKEISVNDLPAGLYTLIISNDAYYLSDKILIIR